MAKQMGIHQIRGKVGGRSYYKTKGVEEGVSRSINQGLSARVKSADEFANTRLNNAEFKNANSIATGAFKSVNTRKRGMMRNFAISAMTKAALESIKQGTGSWGNRKPTEEMDQLICNLLENHAKGGAYDNKYGIFSTTGLSSAGALTISLGIDVQTVNSLMAEGIDGIVVVPSLCLGSEITLDGVSSFLGGNHVDTPSTITFEAGVAISSSISGNVSTPASVGMGIIFYNAAVATETHGFYACLSILPYRIQNGSMYTLQEKCTFVSIPLGQIPD